MAVKHSTASDGTFSGSGATAWDSNHTVDDNTLVAAKLSAAASSRFFGRITAGAGAGEELTAANAKTILSYGLASSDFANQGTTTTVLHGNASGNPSFGAVVEADITLADNTTNDVSTSRHGLAPKAPNDATKYLDGTGAYSVPAGSAALSGISAATASHTIASGNNTGQVWNWANASDSTVAFTFGETSAATGGTSTSGVPNQVLLKLTTAAASTQSPLSVYSRAAHVFSVSPTTRQILAYDGAFGNPVFAFAANVAQGMYRSGNNIFIVTGATAGNFSALNSDGATVLQADNTGIACGAAGGSTTVAAFNYINDPNTGVYFPAADTLGLLAGGAQIMNLQKSSSGGGWAIMDEADSDPTTAQLDAADSIAFYNKNNKMVFAYNNGGTITYISIALDGSSTAWTHSTTAP